MLSLMMMVMMMKNKEEEEEEKMRMDGRGWDSGGCSAFVDCSLHTALGLAQIRISFRSLDMI